MINQLKKEYDINYYKKRTYEFNVRYPYLENVADVLYKKFHPLKLLDVGCAKGFLVCAFHRLGVDAYGVDLSSYAISQSPIEVNNHLSQCDVEHDKLPFNDNEFDMITSLECMEHVVNHENIISEMARVLKDGGIVTISAPKITVLRVLFNLIFGQSKVHPSEFTKNKWITLFTSKGFYYDGDYLKGETEYTFKKLWDTSESVTKTLPPTLWFGKLLVWMKLTKLRTYLNMIIWESERFTFRLNKEGV
jgi:ubiquinone/menaquinone biosynthesis C-methylase UbiE